MTGVLIDDKQEGFRVGRGFIDLGRFVAGVENV